MGLLALATLSFLHEARADEPMLAIRLTSGASALYAVSEIERIDFEGQDTLSVVVGGACVLYASSEIARIEFLWNFSNVHNQMDAAAFVHTFCLFQNQPNPFSPTTRIRFELAETTEVELVIFSPDGRLVRSLFAGTRAAGPHALDWDGCDDSGRAVPGGVYFYSLRGPGIAESRRMILVP